jgi:hypothetical protein
LVEVVVFCKMGPATPEVHLTVSVVPHLSKLKVQKHLWAFIFCPNQKIRQRQYIKDKIHVQL